jgi:hypothetical protein
MIVVEAHLCTVYVTDGCPVIDDANAGAADTVARRDSLSWVVRSVVTFISNKPQAVTRVLHWKPLLSPHRPISMVRVHALVGTSPGVVTL